MKFTTSWDDGHPSDMRLAELLEHHGAKGTFYIAQKHDRDRPSLSESELKTLSQRMEIGAHTLTHPELTAIAPEAAKREIEGSKAWLESTTGKVCDMFCYPRGKYDDDIKSMVKSAGFSGARTTENFRFSHDDPFALPSTVHVYHFPLRPVANRRCFDPAIRAWSSLDELGIGLTARRSWLAMAIAVFDEALKRDAPWFHLRGHSWELDSTHMWQDLDRFLAYVEKHDVEHVPNSRLLIKS